MSSNFKKQAAQVRTAIPQIDPEATKPLVIVPTKLPIQPKVVEPVKPAVIEQPQETIKTEKQPEALNQQSRITQVDTNETPTNRGFSMYPSRHRQIAKDLAYLEDRNPWQIIEDALEEYVVKHYGKEYKRS
jgi:hypothetical protein